MVRRGTPMEIKVGIESMRECINHMEEEGKWHAWYDHYYQTYQAAFDAILNHLLKRDVEGLKGRVKEFDFQEAVKQGEQFVEDGGVEKVRETLEKAQEFCRTTSDFDVYLLIGLGMFGAVSLHSGTTPLLCLEVETYGRELWKGMTFSIEWLETLVAHEYCHIVRMSAIVEHPSQLEHQTMKDVIISEGLATLFPVVMQSQEVTPNAVVTGGMMTDEMAQYCRKHEEELFEEMRNEWDHQLNRTFMEKYFQSTKTGWKEDGRPARTGYYLGSTIIQDLLEHEYEICELTKTPTEQLLTWWERGK